MEYKYCKNDNFEDFSSGSVLYNDKTVTNFPVRLAQELFSRCVSYSTKKTGFKLYDCCCGGGYLLTVLGFLNAAYIQELIGSDIKPYTVSLAQKNLSLLDVKGLDERINQIQEMIQSFHKESHLQASLSANRLKSLIMDHKINVHTFTADALSSLPSNLNPDIILTDVPYGDLTSWEGATNGSVDLLLDSLYSVCDENTILGLCMDKSQKNTNPKFLRLEKQQIGKRKFEILKKK